MTKVLIAGAGAIGGFYGALPGSIGPKTETLSMLFNQPGIECIATTDIATERRKKCVWNRFMC
jgi:hypothetical protein